MTMDSETNQSAEANIILGKRKRSPNNEAVASPKDTHADPESSHHHGLETGSSSLGTIYPSAKTSEVIRSYAPGEEQVCTTTNFMALPPQLLQYICCLVDPFTLSSLLRVNSTFRALLDPRLALPSSQSCIVSFIPQEAVWTSSRTTFMPDIPRPMTSMSEHDTLRLVYGRVCQFCGKSANASAKGTGQTRWDAGPGPNGVRAIWPFRVKSCSDCLRVRLVKEFDLMLTSASTVQPGLPFACFTPSLNYITSISLRQPAVPSRLKLTKYYYQPQIEELEKRREHERLGVPGALEQWHRGLDVLLQDSMSDCLRFEEWEELSRSLTSLDLVPADTASASSRSGPSGRHVSTAPRSNRSSTTQSRWQTYKSVASMHSNNLVGTISGYDVGMPQVAVVNEHQRQLFPSAPASAAPSHASSSTIAQNYSRAAHNVSDIVRLKAEKRAEIEQRCKEMVPPILPHELESMKAFHAALQIPRPLNEATWEHLKGRLILERDEQVASLSANLHDDATSVSFRQTVIEEAPEVDITDSAYSLTQAQRPTRDKLYEIAQEFIKRFYMSGSGLTEATAPQFAADVLRYVRQQFYANQEREDAALALHGHPPLQESQSGMRTRTLILEHMKYVFEACVKPYTELISKELFLCSACEVHDKHFGFDAIIQHYAAKHTADLSRGTTVVYWKAVWPETPPFHPNPGNLSTTEVTQFQLGAPYSQPAARSLESATELSPPMLSRTIGRSENFVQPQQQYLRFESTNYARKPDNHRPGLYVGSHDYGSNMSYQNPALLQHPQIREHDDMQSSDGSRPIVPFPERMVSAHGESQFFGSFHQSSVATRPNRSEIYSGALQEQHRPHEQSSRLSEGEYTSSYIDPLRRTVQESPPRQILVSSVKEDDIKSTTLPQLERADQFLDSLDPFGPQSPISGNLPRRTTTPGATLVGQDSRFTAGVSMDRRSNISQPRRLIQTRQARDTDHNQYDNGFYRRSIALDDPPATAHLQSYEDMRYSDRQRYDLAQYPSGNHDFESRQLHPNPAQPLLPYSHENIGLTRIIDEQYDDVHRLARRPQNFDQYGRPIRSPSPQPVTYRVTYEPLPLQARREDDMYEPYRQSTRQPLPPRDQTWRQEGDRQHFIEDQRAQHSLYDSERDLMRRQAWNDPHPSEQRRYESRRFDQPPYRGDEDDVTAYRPLLSAPYPPPEQYERGR